MGRLFPVLQTSANCCKRSEDRLGSSFVGYATGNRSWSFSILVYINDISTDIQSEIKLFADDCVCYREIKQKEDKVKLQNDIDRLQAWARKWGIRFQPVRCNMMQLTRKQTKKQ